MRIQRWRRHRAGLFTLFAAPPEKDLEWSDQGVEGGYRFLSRLWRLVYQFQPLWADQEDKSPHADKPSAELRDLRRLIHRTIKKVTDDIEGQVSFQYRHCGDHGIVNALSVAAQTEPRAGYGATSLKRAWRPLSFLLAPFVPHAANELWEQTGHRETLD